MKSAALAKRHNNAITRPAALLACLAMSVTVLAYLPGMKAGFYFDDLPNIVERPALKWTELSAEGVRQVVNDALLPRRVVANLSFAVNHLFGELDPAGYHWTNLGIHLAVGAALTWVVLLLIGQNRGEQPDRNRAGFSALLATSLFLLHPLNIQAVTNVVQRMTSLATLFFLLAFGLYLTARGRAALHRKWHLYAACTLLWILALGCKEIAIVLPALLGLYEACFHRADWRRRFKRVRTGPGIRRVALSCLAVAVLGAGLWLVSYVSTTLVWNDVFSGRTFTGYQRVLTQARVQWFYLTLLLWPAPSRLNLDHEYQLSLSLLEPWTTLAAVSGLVVVGLGGVWLTRRRPQYGFPVLAYGALHAMESGPINLELVFEHRMYLPMTMMAVLVAHALAGRASRRSHAGIAVALLCMFLAIATYQRNQTWGDPLAFHYDWAAKSPGKFRPHYNLGTELGIRGHYREAEGSLRHALELLPDSSEAHNQLANVYQLTGRADLAFTHYKAAVQHGPENVEAIYNLAGMYERRLQLDQAVEYYRRLLMVAPGAFETQRREVAAKLQAVLERTDGRR